MINSSSICNCGCETCECRNLVESVFTALKPPNPASCSCNKESCLSQAINQHYHFVVKLKPVESDNGTFVSQLSEFLLKQFGFSVMFGIAKSATQENVYSCYFTAPIDNTKPISMLRVLTVLSSFEQLVVECCETLVVAVIQVTEGMTCMNCVNTITTKFEQNLQQAHYVICSLEKKQVFIFSHINDPVSTVSCVKLLENIGKKGYTINNEVFSTQETHLFHISVPNMKCNSCVTKIKDKLATMSGFVTIHSDLSTKICTIAYSHSIPVEQVGQLLIETITDMGFKAHLQHYEISQIVEDIELKVRGMKCNGCVTKITNRLLDTFQKSIGSVQVDLENQIVRISNATVSKSELAYQIQELGFLIDESLDHVSIDVVATSSQLDLEDILVEPSSTNNEDKAIVSIEGMSCSSCVAKIEKKILGLKGVSSCDVNLITQKGEIVYNRSLISEDDIISAITGLGFDSTSLTKRMNESGCVVLLIEDLKTVVSEVENIFSNFSGVTSYELDVAKNTVRIEYQDDVTCPRMIIDALKLQNSIESTVYHESGFDMKASILRTREIRKWKVLFIISAVFTIPAMIFAMIFGNIKFFNKYVDYQLAPGFTVEALVMIVLVTPVQFICGFPFYKLAVQALRNLSPDMNVLIAIAATEAYLYSIFAVIYGAVITKKMQKMRHNGDMVMIEHYFETAAALIMFLLLGRWMENVAKGKTSSALVALMDLQPSVATLLENKENPSERISVDDCINKADLLNEREISIDLVATGDILKVTAGSKIPVDGIVVYGSSTVDEAMITGESLPVYKTVDSKVIGGTINSDGLLFVKATKVGADSTLRAITDLVEQSQMSKPKIQGVADKISGWFVPCVILLSLLVFIIWIILGATKAYPAKWRPANMHYSVFALLISTATVIVACPCSIGLATPTAVMVGTGVAAKHGLLMKGGKALESVSKCTAILFDKTGTLTKGELRVTEHRIFEQNYSDPLQFSQLCAWLYVIEKASEHPIARALCAFAEQHMTLDNQYIPTDFVTVAGRGVSASVNGQTVHVGNEAFMHEQNINMTSDHSYNKYSTIVFVSVNGTLAITLLLSDVIRDESRSVVATLKSYRTGIRRRRIRVFMLTGDNEFAAHHIAAQVGIEPENVFSQLTPGGKCAKVQELQTKGEIVLMVGDGINDSPSLTQADASVAVGGGTDVAVECADIVLMRPGIDGLVTALDLSRTIYRRILANFIWAFGYNALAIPIAAGVFFPLIKYLIPPWVAGLAMVLSSITVLVSSLLLRLYRKPRLIHISEKDNSINDEVHSDQQQDSSLTIE